MNKSRPAISVVIPAYNEEEYLPSCLASFQKQTFKDFEIIVVDNNSTDKTAQIAKSFGAKVVREKKQGLIAARERGFKEAKAEIIARTDADSIVSPNWLEIIYETFKLHPKLVAITGNFISPSKKITNRILGSLSFLIAQMLGHLFFGHTYLIGANMALKKTAWKKIRVHSDDSFVVEDGDLSCHLAKIGEIRYLPYLTVTLSLRRVQKNPLKGTLVYLIEYPIRFLRTIWLHHLKSGRFPLSKIRKSFFAFILEKK